MIELYSPHATWARVKSAAQGANVLIYLGHGNGYPSPYGAFSAHSKDGMGLNSSDGSSSHTYYGEYYIDHDIQLATNAVVILNRLCYASGNNEWGAGYPTRSTAMARADNYGAGFLRANAKAVFAEGIDSVSYILYGLFRTDRSMTQIWWSDPARDGRWDFGFNSSPDAGLPRLDGSDRRIEPLLPLARREHLDDGEGVARGSDSAVAAAALPARDDRPVGGTSRVAGARPGVGGGAAGGARRGRPGPIAARPRPSGYPKIEVGRGGPGSSGGWTAR